MEKTKEKIALKTANTAAEEKTAAGNKIFRMQCSSCSLIGEFEEFIEEFKCPKCGARMELYKENIKNFDSTNTVSIPKKEIEEYRKKLKVAKPVNTGAFPAMPSSFMDSTTSASSSRSLNSTFKFSKSKTVRGLPAIQNLKTQKLSGNFTRKMSPVSEHDLTEKLDNKNLKTQKLKISQADKARNAILSSVSKRKQKQQDKKNLLYKKKKNSAAKKLEQAAGKSFSDVVTGEQTLDYVKNHNATKELTVKLIRTLLVVIIVVLLFWVTVEFLTNFSQ